MAKEVSERVKELADKKQKVLEQLKKIEDQEKLLLAKQKEKEEKERVKRMDEIGQAVENIAGVPLTPERLEKFKCWLDSQNANDYSLYIAIGLTDEEICIIEEKKKTEKS